MKTDHTLAPQVAQSLHDQAALHRALARDLLMLALRGTVDYRILEEVPLLRDWAPVRGIEEILLEGELPPLVYRGLMRIVRTGHRYYLDGDRGLARDLDGWWRLGRCREG